MLPWSLYGLTPRDLSGELLRTWNHIVDAQTLAGSSPGAAFTVPADRVAIITQISSKILLAGDQPISLDVVVNEPGLAGNSLALSFPYIRSTTGTHQNFIAGGFVYFIAGPNTSIDFQLVTSTVLGVQIANFSFAGFLIPRGDATYV